MTWARLPIKVVENTGFGVYPTGTDVKTILNSTFTTVDPTKYIHLRTEQDKTGRANITFALDTSSIPLGCEISSLRLKIGYKFSEATYGEHEVDIYLKKADDRLYDLLIDDGSVAEWIDNEHTLLQYEFQTFQYTNVPFLRKDLDGSFQLYLYNYSLEEFQISCLYIEVDYYPSTYNAPVGYIYIKNASGSYKIPYYNASDGFLNSTALRVNTKHGVKILNLMNIASTSTDKQILRFKAYTYGPIKYIYLESK